MTTKENKKSEIIYTESLPDFSSLAEESLVIYDDILPKVSKVFKKKLKTAKFTYPVKAGESLKDIKNFPKHITALVNMTESSSVSKLTIVVVGGGSVGDFGGFIASVLKRGVGLIHIPTTWLSAVDSAHGGKTALNVAAAKNQIGTFYPASKIIISKDLLLAQSVDRAVEGFGELLKMALIDGGKFWKNLSQENYLSSGIIWKYLEVAVQGKYKVVKKDPEEKKGLRHVLNLGHTVGHVLEVMYKMPHGIAVNYGLGFSLEYSRHLGVMSEKVYQEILDSPISAFLLMPSEDGLLSTDKATLKDVKHYLAKDKKKTQASQLRFVFVKSPGNTEIKDIQINDLLLEWVRQAKSNGKTK